MVRRFPATLIDLPKDDRIASPNVFDPALRHIFNGFRRGEPIFTDPAIAQRWRAARRSAMHAILRLVNYAPWTDVLVLRGSIVLKAWYGDVAREPGDIDWIVRSPDGASGKTWTTRAISELIEVILANSPETIADGQTIEFIHRDIRMDGIWSYERAPGMRLVIPWRSGDLPVGIVQCDFVSGEELSLPAEQTQIADGLKIWTASKAMSLAWKLQWLQTDEYPQGKDLYDAVLLAEEVSAPAQIVRDLIETDPTPYHKDHPFGADSVLQWDVDWETFTQEYPSVKGSVEEWKQRLADAIRPAFGNTSS
jgi:hypothetical protein